MNYKFSEEDTHIIRNWIKENLLVNVMILQEEIEETEKNMILEYHPIINLSNNPYTMQIVSDLREECVRIAKEM